MSEKTASWWADEVIRRMEADPNTDLAPVAVGQMITAQVFAEAIAAAEERGRRRGVEESSDEAGKLRVILLHARRWMRTDSPSWVKAEADAVLPRNLKDLAPRDSGKE